MSSIGRRLVTVNGVVAVALTAYFLVAPPVRSAISLTDAALRGPGVPAFAWRLHERLAPRYAAWASARVEAKRAADDNADVAGTEWPLFGSVFYLWAIENLQADWAAGSHDGHLEPKVVAHDAIVAASELVVDPSQATWVRHHWGPNYLHEQNVFYRMLLIAALTSRAKLLNDGAHLDLLRDQVESLAAELDASPHGMLADYPGETYPGDVMAAVMCIRRADAVLGTDHAAFAARAERAFTGHTLTELGLPPFRANQDTGEPLQPARGSGNSYVTLLAPELWPGTARAWFDTYDAHFFQARWLAVGFREYAATVGAPEWFVEVDAGPVLAGHGISASAFGVGAARRNGRFDRAFPLAAEMIATSWELPSGTLFGPAFLSNAIDAPMLGEAAVLWLLTVPSAPGFPVQQGGALPPFVLVVLLGPALLGLAHGVSGVRRVRQALKHAALLPMPRLHAAVWLALVVPSLAALGAGSWRAGLLALGLCTVLPMTWRKA